ncbi:MAG: riboflavin synthase RibE [Bacteroidetes bacterium HLUCCA01]|nr:MAG: riboflavin synthase RibE [Bacteroidetes bacterium HLUCCA01]
MFTGIIEDLGEVIEAKSVNGGMVMKFSCQFAGELSVDDSVSVNGVCQTVVACDESTFTTQLVEETLRKTSFGQRKPGDKVNLERSLTFDQRLDGHVVQGHVDTVGTVKEVLQEETGWLYTIAFPDEYADYIVGRGSIALDGISLTVARDERTDFTVAIIPFTYEHTNMHTLKPGDQVNLEFDILGKYVLRYLKNREGNT